jgi:hypothetical protein
VLCHKILSHYLPGGTEGNHESFIHDVRSPSITFRERTEMLSFLEHFHKASVTHADTNTKLYVGKINAKFGFEVLTAVIKKSTIFCVVQVIAQRYNPEDCSLQILTCFPSIVTCVCDLQGGVVI